MRRFKGEGEHFSFNKCPIYTHDGASAKFSTNSQEMDNSEWAKQARRLSIIFVSTEESNIVFIYKKQSYMSKNRFI